MEVVAKNAIAKVIQTLAIPSPDIVLIASIILLVLGAKNASRAITEILYSEVSLELANLVHAPPSTTTMPLNVLFPSVPSKKLPMLIRMSMFALVATTATKEISVRLVLMVTSETRLL